MSLYKIQNSVQEVAEAISAVLNVDVTIIDENLYRVAATGKYKLFIGEKIPTNCSYELIFKNQKPEFIQAPKDNKVCQVCSRKDKCIELATLGYPIIKSEKCIGVIGLNAFNEEQKNNMMEKYNSLLVFLSKLSDLLIGNLNYYETIAELTIKSEETEKIIDGLENGIIGVDNKGKIKFVNSKIENFFGISKENIIDKYVKDILPELDVDLDNYNPHEKKLKIFNKKLSFIIRSIPVVVENKKVSNILEINKTTDMVRNAYKIVGVQNNIKFEDIIGNSEEIIKVKKIANQVAQSDSTVLLRGESGTGKELFARAIHYASLRKQAPIIPINCASIPDNLLESELFGYEGGAFTGARKEGQMGKFELANGGTLFLDEIGDLPIHLQPKLLRVLQEQSFMRIGGKDMISINFRLIAATNRNLEKMVEEGKFREDLYYRLNIIPIHIPPLRDRKKDILILSKFMLRKYCIRLEKDIKGFSSEVNRAFVEYNWPGNIRELENVVEYLVNIVNEDIINFKDLPIVMKEFLNREAEDVSPKTLTLKSRVESHEKDIIGSMLRKYGTSTKAKKQISNILDIDLATLYRKLSKYDLQ